MALIELRHLHKVYGSVQALQDLNLEIPEACLYGLLGPNGAGKTTALRILATLLAPDSGEVRVDGIDALQRYLGGPDHSTGMRLPRLLAQS